MGTVEISSLRFYPGNARRGDIDTIAESLKHLGQYKPVVVNRGTVCPDLANTILAGNHTTMAAQRLGWTTVNVTWMDVDADTAKRIVLVDNRTNDLATYDVEALLDLATDLPDYTATGFTQDDIDTLLEALEGQGDDTDIPMDTGPAEPEGYGLIVECDSADQRDLLKAKLLAEGYNAGNA